MRRWIHGRNHEGLVTRSSQPDLTCWCPRTTVGRPRTRCWPGLWTRWAPCMRWSTGNRGRGTFAVCSWRWWPTLRLWRPRTRRPRTRLATAGDVGTWTGAAAGRSCSTRRRTRATGSAPGTRRSGWWPCATAACRKRYSSCPGSSWVTYAAWEWCPGRSTSGWTPTSAVPAGWPTVPSHCCSLENIRRGLQ